MLLVGMLFGLLVLGPLVMLLVFAFLRGERPMRLLRRTERQPSSAASAVEREPSA